MIIGIILLVIVGAILCRMDGEVEKGIGKLMLFIGIPGATLLLITFFQQYFEDKQWRNQQEMNYEVAEMVNCGKFGRFYLVENDNGTISASRNWRDLHDTWNTSRNNGDNWFRAIHLAHGIDYSISFNTSTYQIRKNKSSLPTLISAKEYAAMPGWEKYDYFQCEPIAKFR